MTYKETKERGAHIIVNTTYYGSGSYLVNDHEINPITGNVFFTTEEAQECVKRLRSEGYISDGEYNTNPRRNIYTYDLWEDADEYLDDLLEEESNNKLPN